MASARARTQGSFSDFEFYAVQGGCGLARRDSLAIEPSLIRAASCLGLINQRHLSLGALTLPSPCEQDSERMRIGENLAQSFRGAGDGIREEKWGPRQTLEGDLQGLSGPRTQISEQGKG